MNKSIVLIIILLSILPSLAYGMPELEYGKDILVDGSNIIEVDTLPHDINVIENGIGTVDSMHGFFRDAEWYLTDNNIIYIMKKHATLNNDSDTFLFTLVLAIIISFIAVVAVLLMMKRRNET